MCLGDAAVHVDASNSSTSVFAVASWTGRCSGCVRTPASTILDGCRDCKSCSAKRVGHSAELVWAAKRRLYEAFDHLGGPAFESCCRPVQLIVFRAAWCRDPPRRRPCSALMMSAFDRQEVQHPRALGIEAFVRNAHAPHGYTQPKVAEPMHNLDEGSDVCVVARLEHEEHSVSSPGANDVPRLRSDARRVRRRYQAFLCRLTWAWSSADHRPGVRVGSGRFSGEVGGVEVRQGGLKVVVVERDPRPRSATCRG